MAQHTDRDAEFSAFLADDSGPLARAAWQVADGDRDAASEVLQSALVKTYVAWPRVGPDGALAHTLGLIGAPGGDSSGTDPVDVDLDAEHVLAEGRNAVRGRRMGWTVAGLATLAVVASIVTPVLIASTVPPVPTPPPVATPSATPTPTATTASATTPASLEGTPWQVAGFEGVAFAPGQTMTLQFDGAVASGFSGCNSFRADYDQNGDRLRFDHVAVGAMGCAGKVGREENAFLDALARVRVVEEGLNGPVLRDKDGAPMVALVPLTPDATTWHLAELAGAEQLDSVITLTVAGDRLTGNSGCGTYTAGLSRDGDAWAVSDVELTSTVRCPQAANRRATRYLDLLGQATTAELDAFRLTLTGPDGELAFTVAG